jgi:hypothetical protein
MTTNHDPLNALLLACVTLLVPSITCQPVTTAIHFRRQVYDYALTFQREVSPLPSILHPSSHAPQVELVWKRRWGLGTLLFAFNRYSPFIENIISLSSESVTCTGKSHPNMDHS